MKLDWANIIKGGMTMIAGLCAILPHAFPACAPYAEGFAATAAALVFWAHGRRPGDAKVTP